ncbi:hypothetical protein [Nocardiopsis ganjiahuensis]|uniref:hypothetical protein n=1 Tax=Nocardiopsis ganjiahuensis TaxID=239984 RepID=UPI00034B8E36|nr:hypothetical protein [Nocardiopsis ganjiahuensis]
MPKMLTVDEQFEAIVVGAETTAKLNPYQEPNPEQGSPSEEKPAESAPAEEKPSEEK